ncbi:MAG: carbohydrate binding family 9 domain-containing protein [Gemmatimonadetes bacterium]|nr:carbohydrate binding family 9 domain-containing protein [Gemmatimonadota bacterium]
MSAVAVLAFAAAVQMGGEEGPSSSARGASASVSVPASAVAVYEGRQGALEVAAPWVAEADIAIDGRLSEAVWQKASLLTAFTQYDPVEGGAATQDTEVRMLVTDDAILFGIRARDSEPDGVRASLARRDQYGRSDDWVRIVLDTFGAQREAFVFQVNPLGIQGDGLWVEGGGGWGDPIDWSPDFLWSSEGRIDPEGYTVEMRIPLKSLRFPEASLQDWGLQVTRRIQRNGYESTWAPRTRAQANGLAQTGRIEGLRDLDPGVFLEVNPVLTGAKSGAWSSDSGRLAWTPSQQEVGLNLSYGLTSNLTLTGTVNPDFSQVEADAGQITVNERFALFLPERRPFFLEGTELFQMPRRLVYTRAIANPTGAAKVSGKVGGTNIAYLGAVDDLGGGAERPVFNILRVRRDVGASSTVGAVYTDRTLSGDDFNRVAGIDGRFIVGGRYTLEFLAAGSADGRQGAGADWGSLLSASLDRSGRSFSFGASFEDATEDFRARSGFIRRVGVTEAEANARYTFRGDRGALVESWGPSISVESLWDRAAFWSGAGALETQAELDMRVSLRGNLGVSVSLGRSTFNTPASDYTGLVVDGAQEVDGATPSAFTPRSGLFEGMLSLRFRSWIRSWERVRLSFSGGWSESPLFDRSTGAPVDLGARWNGEVGVTLIPTGSLQTELGLRHVTLRRTRDGSTYSSATIPRIQARYQFSRSIYGRVNAEYSSQDRGLLLDPATGRPIVFCEDGSCSARSASESHRLAIDALVGYEPSPGTVFFIGYARQANDPTAFGFQNVQTQSEGVFVKLSYRFRM